MTARACPECGGPVERRREYFDADYCPACDRYPWHRLSVKLELRGPLNSSALEPRDRESTALFNARFWLTVIESAIKGERTLEPSGPALESMRANVVALITHLEREADS